MLVVDVQNRIRKIIQMNFKELNMFAEAVYWHKQYVDSNPDVGMGPSIDTLIKKISFRLSIELDTESLETVKRLVVCKNERLV